MWRRAAGFGLEGEVEIGGCADGVFVGGETPPLQRFGFWESSQIKVNQGSNFMLGRGGGIWDLEKKVLGANAFLTRGRRSRGSFSPHVRHRRHH
jgi:hypothetical protein